MDVALQLYTVRAELTQDFAGTLRRLRDIGYRAVETYPFPSHVTCRIAAEILKDCELAVVAMHCDLPAGAALNETIHAAADLGCGRIIWHGWPRPSEFDSEAGIRELAVRYNQVQHDLSKHGLAFGLHNHWWEFEQTQGSFPWKLFDELLHPEIFLELDTYWVKTAGLDPVSVVRQLSHRIQLLHLKDGPAVHGKPMTALGEGTLDFKAILTAAADPRPQLVVELDECAGDIFTAVKRSLHYLMRLSI